jgi:transcriptional regulator with XRE-family HTH domain
VAIDLRKGVGRRVRELRQQQRISQEALADLADLHRNAVGDIERGIRDVGILAVGQLTAALGVSLEEFFEADAFGKTTSPPSAKASGAGSDVVGRRGAELAKERRSLQRHWERLPPTTRRRLLGLIVGLVEEQQQEPPTTRRKRPKE